ncbi:MAG: hypothetical protein LBT79_06320, partial [Elusimicrobiota bacterium]|nr:hypothetical protein [Elusimicrobiota bacterium]
MSKKAFVLSFILLIILIIAAIILFRIQDNKNVPIEQILEESYITVTAPPFTRSAANEEKIKNSFKSKIKEAYFYK